MDLDTILTRFEQEYLEINSISPARRLQQFSFLRNLAASLDHPLTELSGRDARAFIGAELARGLHPNTGRKYVGFLRSFTNWAELAGALDPVLINELKLVRNPRGSSAQNAPRPYKPSEIKAMYAEINAYYPMLPVQGRGKYALRRFTAGKTVGIKRHLWRHARRLQLEAQVALALELGLRRVEIIRTTIPALHYDNAHVVVLTAKQGPGIEPTRSIPYTNHARQVMQEWLDFRLVLGPRHDYPWLLLPQQGNTIEQTEPQSYHALVRALRNVGPWSWHRLRHTAATEWLSAGVDLEKVREFMGHASIEQTLAYTKIKQSDVDTAFSEAEATFAARLGLAA